MSQPIPEPLPGPDWRGCFPFPLGAPSWVHGFAGDNVWRNVEYLSQSVDRVQLLLFGKDHLEEMLEPGLMARLAQLAQVSGLSFSLHLPADLYLLDQADEPGILESSIDLVADIRARSAAIDPVSGILHLDSRQDLRASVLQDRVARVLDALRQAFPDAAGFFRIENTRHDLTACRQIFESREFGLCADFGHLWHHGQSIPHFVGGLGHLIREIHLSGFNQNGDHLPLAELVESAQSDVISCLAANRCPVTLEIFQASAYWESVATLAKLLEGILPCRSPKPSSPSKP